MQIIPYLGGIVLVSALVVLMAGLAGLASRALRPRVTVALMLMAVFATMIFFNYAVQTTFVPTLIGQPDMGNRALLAALSMSNPDSLGWALEMWGWGFFGVATALVAPVFEGGHLARATRWAFYANGVVSVAGTIWTALDPEPRDPGPPR